MSENQTLRSSQTRHRAETSRVGKRGAVVVPARMRRKFGIEEGSLVIAEEREDGILIRPAVAVPVEIYTPARIAEFLLSNALDAREYKAARLEVRKMGLDPDRITHRNPPRK
jgi:AbrB family looped-hinge helix DNA binding protein